jgi:hypothetical protein
VQAAEAALALHNQAIPAESIQTHLTGEQDLIVNFTHLLLQVVVAEQAAEQQPALQQAGQEAVAAIQGQN